jgi:hypothetical protein
MWETAQRLGVLRGRKAKKDVVIKKVIREFKAYIANELSLKEAFENPTAESINNLMESNNFQPLQILKFARLYYRNDKDSKKEEKITEICKICNQTDYNRAR